MRKAVVSALVGVSLLANGTAAMAEGAEGAPRDPSKGDLSAPSENCNRTQIQRFAPANTTVSVAVRETSGICRVHGFVTTQNPGPNEVNFVLALPDKFNGRYLFLGVGGAAGNIPAIQSSLTAKGYAQAGTDAGTSSGSIADFSFKSDPAKLVDFLWRGVQSSAVATQQITRGYYKREKIGRYISGCSGGGQMGLTSAIRFGGDTFDGIVSAATVWPGAAFKPNVYRIIAHMQNNPEGWLPPDLLRRTHAAIVARYDETDGAKDGIVHDARNVQSFDLGILRDNGWTPAQIETFTMITSPIKLTGKGIYEDGMQAGWPVNDLAGWIRYLTGTVPPPWKTTKEYSTSALQAMGTPFYHVMADTNIRSLQPDLDYWTIKDMKQLVALSNRNGTEQSTDTLDLSKIAGSKAKMIIWHGTADEANSYLDNLRGYEEVVAKFPSAKDWLQIYFIPGTQHCRGGNGPTEIDDPMIDAVADWFETGKAPEFILAPRETPEKGIDRIFRLCPEPKRSVLKSPHLDPNVADNWECRAVQS